MDDGQTMASRIVERLDGKKLHQDGKESLGMHLLTAELYHWTSPIKISAQLTVRNFVTSTIESQRPCYVGGYSLRRGTTLLP